MDRVGGKESGIKDFDPQHNSCPLIDFFGALWFQILVHTASPLRCCKKVIVVCWPCARIPLEQGPCCDRILGCSSSAIRRSPLDSLGFRLQIVNVCSSREVAAGSSHPPQLFRRGAQHREPAISNSLPTPPPALLG